MGRADVETAGRGIGREALTTYLEGVLSGRTEVLAVRPLKGGEPAADDPKGFGYGVPLEVECLVDGRPRAFVISRTRPAQGFGHDYPADRAWQALYGHDAYNSFPRHVRSVDVGFVNAAGDIVSAADDVAALGINYLLFGIQRSARAGRIGVDEPFLHLFMMFLDTYLGASGDEEVLDVLPPFLAFRALVLAHPRWYPDLGDASRAALLRFADYMVASTRFVANDVAAAFR